MKSNPDGLVERLNLSEEAQGKRLTETVNTGSFFEEKKIMVISGGLSFFQGLATLLAARGEEENPEWILQEFDVDPEKANPPLFSAIKQQADTVRHFVEMKGTELERWVVGKFWDEDLSISAQALKRLLRTTSFSSLRLEPEIEKIIAYKKYQGPRRRETSMAVEEGEIESLVHSELALNSFELADAIAAKDLRRGLELLHQHLSSGEDAYAILGWLVYQFRNLLKIKSLMMKPVPYANLVGITKLHPFVVKKTYEQAKRFAGEDLKKIYQRLFALEVGAKDGRLDLSLSLYEFLLKM